MEKKCVTSGILLILAGALTLAAAYALHRTTNALLATGLGLILAGVALYVGGIKHGGRY